jgi:hypothetical protein
MATAIAPRNDMYLSVLAGRAVTALADLAGDPAAWNDRVQNGLRDGIVYCQAVRARRGRVLRTTSSEEWSPIRRSVERAPDTGALPDVHTVSEEVERFFRQLASREHTPEIPELVAAIEFLRKTAIDR